MDWTTIILLVLLCFCGWKCWKLWLLTRLLCIWIADKGHTVPGYKELGQCVERKRILKKFFEISRK